MPNLFSWVKDKLSTATTYVDSTIRQLSNYFDLEKFSQGLLIPLNLIMRWTGFTRENGYELLLMSLSRKEVISINKLEKISREHNRMPILLKQGEHIHLYGKLSGGNPEDGWRLTELDQRVFKQLVFPGHHTLKQKNSETLAPVIRTEIYAKHAHLPPRNTARALGVALKANIVIYLGSVWVYEALMKRLMRAAYPDMEDTRAAQLVDMIAACYFTSLKWQMFVMNSANRFSLSKAAIDENPNVLSFPACGDNRFIIAQANLMSPAYYASNLIVTEMIKSTVRDQFSPAIAQIIHPVLLAQVYGHALAEVNFMNSCKKHRYQELATNNEFIFGLGVSFLLSNLLLSKALEKTTGVNNKYTNDAIFSFLYQYFMAATFFINRPYPGVAVGRDFFAPIRKGTDVVLKSVINELTLLLKGPKSEIDWVALANQLNDNRLVQYFKKLMLMKDFQSIENFIKSNTISLLLALRGDEIQLPLQWFIRKCNKLSSQTLPKVVASMIKHTTPYIPSYFVSQAIKEGIAQAIPFVMEKKLNAILIDVDNFIDHARQNVDMRDAEGLRQILAGLGGDAPTDTSLALPAPKEQSVDELPVDATNLGVGGFVLIEPSPERPLEEDFVMMNSQEEKKENIRVDHHNIMFIEDYASEAEVKRRKPEKQNALKAISAKGLQKNSLFCKPQNAEIIEDSCSKRQSHKK